MTSSLVGSEMCIRDRSIMLVFSVPANLSEEGYADFGGASVGGGPSASTCLLYTSDAADDM
eukprot:10797131-Prorocentrum_lima.AAC.1